jgi:hypothetical protein
MPPAELEEIRQNQQAKESALLSVAKNGGADIILLMNV